PGMSVVAALSRVRLAQARPDAARTLLDSVEPELPSISSPLARSLFAAARGHLESMAGDIDASRRHHRQSRQLRLDAGLEEWQWLSELELLTLDLQANGPAEPVRAGAERIAGRLARANDPRSELQARLVEASALI